MKKDAVDNKPAATRGRPRQKDDRLKDIVMKAASVFYKYGYANSSTREIAEAAGISKGLLYYYINSKEDFLDLFIDITTESFGGYNQDIINHLPRTSPAASLKRAIREYISGIDSLQDMILFWYRESGYMSREQLSKVIKQELDAVAFFEAILKSGYQRGEFSEKDTNLAAYHIHSLCNNWVLKRWYLRKRYSIDEYIKKIQKSALAIAGYKGT